MTDKPEERSPEEAEAFDIELNRHLLDPATQARIRAKIEKRLREILGPPKASDP